VLRQLDTLTANHQTNVARFNKLDKKMEKLMQNMNIKEK